MHSLLRRHFSVTSRTSLGFVLLIGACVGGAEGDIASGEQASGEDHGSIVEEKSEALLTPTGCSLWPTHSIEVCFRSPTYDNTALSAWRNDVRNWVAGSISAAADLRFTGWLRCGANTGGMIVVDYNGTLSLSDGWRGFCGYRDGATGHQIVFGTDSTNGTNAKGTVIQTFMRRIGFEYEWTRADNTTNNCSTNAGVTGNTYGTTYDANSIMNAYCGSSTLSTLDKVALRHAYGVLQPNLAIGYTGRGSVSGDQYTDIILTGMTGAWTIPVARSLDNGSFAVWNADVPDFPGWASESGAKAVPGDFDGDLLSDVAIVGMSGSWTIPVAFSNGEGHFYVTNSSVPSFPGWAGAAGAKAVPGDFNGDGRSDIALVGASGWTSIKVAFSNGDGSFHVTNVTNADSTNFSTWAAQSGVIGAKAVAGDFNHDDRSDIALVGMYGAWTIPVAFSNGDGTFSVTNESVTDFPTWAQFPGNKPVSGDFNGDGYSDIALVGAAGAWTIPVAYSTGGGGFNVTNVSVATFPGLASQSGARPVAGDFSNDGRSDIALVGMAGGTTIPVASAQSGGTFSVTNVPVSDFPTWATHTGAQAIGGY